MSKKKVVSENSPKTFAEVIAVLQDMDDLSKTRRRDLISALRSMARFIDKDVGLVPANTEWLRQRLRQLHPRQVRVSEKHFQNVKSAVIAALKMTSGNNKRLAAFPEMTSEFDHLYQAIPDRMIGYKLSRFFRFCSEHGLSSNDVSDETVAEFESCLISETLHKNPGKVVREAVLTWNKMRDAVPGWPVQNLTLKPKREPWTIPLEQFPTSFVADVDKWCDRLGHKDLFDEDAPVRPCEPATIKHRRFQIRMMASAIVKSGVPINNVTSLAILVEIENFKQGLQFMLDRQDGEVKEANFTLASGIKAIAKHHIKVPEDHMNKLQRICSRLDQTADRYRKKNKERLAQFDDRRNLALLLALPARLARLSEKPGPKPRSPALLLQSAVAIEILILCPMRIGNLATLDTERHLRWIKERRSLRLIIDIPANEVKNDKPLRYELAGSSAMLVQDYIERVRPKLCSTPTTALFPKMSGATRNPGDLSHQIKRHCYKETGLVVNAHLFRSLASKIHNIVSAGDAATISHVLGDKITTVMRAYTQFEQKSALDHYQRSVTLVRNNDDEDDGSDAA
jgi:integrase